MRVWKETRHQGLAPEGAGAVGLGLRLSLKETSKAPRHMQEGCGVLAQPKLPFAGFETRDNTSASGCCDHDAVGRGGGSHVLAAM